MRQYSLFRLAIEQVERDLKTIAYEVENERWQSIDISDKPGHRMKEVFNTSFAVSLNYEKLDYYREDIKPNLPWADDHFEERVSRHPLNPGEQWKNWPWSLSADKHRTEGEQFSHTYMERYWPQFAGAKPGGIRPSTSDSDVNALVYPKMGIRYRYGDLDDLTLHLFTHPETRQAFLPIWFPEDTGVVHGGRVPCTLGYHFMQRMGYLHMTYYIRSCDFTRHFRDDLYLSLRLQLWMLTQLRKLQQKDERKPAPFPWDVVKPGLFVFHCASMHCFENDLNASTKV